MPVVFGESSLKILPLAGLLVQLVVCVIVEFSRAAQVRNAKVKNDPAPIGRTGRERCAGRGQARRGRTNSCGVHFAL